MLRTIIIRKGGVGFQCPWQMPGTLAVGRECVEGYQPFFIQLGVSLFPGSPHHVLVFLDVLGLDALGGVEVLRSLVLHELSVVFPQGVGVCLKVL